MPITKLVLKELRVNHDH